MSTWPADADGDVLRRLEDAGFDFAAEHAVDFTVDFTQWPPPTRAIEILKARYPVVELIEPEGVHEGYVLVVQTSTVSHCFVVDTQEALSVLMEPYGGKCDSWGVPHG